MSATRKVRFTVTDQHLKLLRRMCVGWQDCETGAPEIDPKRPYGNSDVFDDVVEILGVKPNYSKHGEILDGLEEKMMKLHRETETALQIVLSTGAFKAGTYECGEYEYDWKLVKEA